jgi:recombination protein RecA
MISTRSTLLDLAISGGKTETGGLPGGILVEIHGQSSLGKTGLIAEIASEVKLKGGELLFCDPEGRLNIEYTEITGLKIEPEEYCRPNTVSELFNIIYTWKPKNPDAINMIAADSLAALSTELELEDGDKMGMRRAKEFSEGLRKTCRLIANNNWLIVCSNQERESQTGVVTPGGKGIPYYATVRIRLTPDKPAKIEKEKKIGKKTLTKVVGIRSLGETKKNSFDDPFRTCPISFVFNYGIDDIRDQLQWYKEVSGDDKYNVFDNEYSIMDAAVKHIEDNNFEQRLKSRTIKKWKEIEDAFKIPRKKRF